MIRGFIDSLDEEPPDTQGDTHRDTQEIHGDEWSSGADSPALAALIDQLAKKDEQIAKLMETVADSTKAVQGAQALHHETAPDARAGIDRAEAEPLAKAQEGLEGLAMKWNVSVLRRSGECERTEVADFELSEFFNRIASAEGKAWVLSVERVGDVGDSALVEPDGDELVSQLGKRRWRVMGDPEDGWWVEVDSDGNELPGDWEYDRKGGYVYCAFA